MMMVRGGKEAKLRICYTRLKREDCKHTKHDSVFSKWEILIGPNDWEDHASGKDGVERYRIHNLPKGSSCSGLYELGVASIAPIEGLRFRKLDPENIIVVYLGQADNVRTRLQEYGRSGSHLDHGNLITSSTNYESLSPLGGPGLFRDIFSKGYSILFRWAPLKNKIEAEKTETELLRVFDYAWNTRGNGVCRRVSILAKLNHNSLIPGHSPLRKLQQWKQAVFNKKEGINIDTSMTLLEKESPLHGLKRFLFPRIFKFSVSQLQFLTGDDSYVSGKGICGVATGHGSICRNQAALEKKRCAQHKGKKITGSSSASRRMAIVASRKSTFFSDVPAEDGLSCLDSPTHGTKICELQKGRSTCGSILDEKCSPLKQFQSQLAQEEVKHEKEDDFCGVVYGDGSLCRRMPVLGKKRCEQHKGQRVVIMMPSFQKICNSLELNNVCGVLNNNGDVCSRLPVPGRKRCKEHKGRRLVAAAPILVNTHAATREVQFPICGVISSGDSVCMRSPVPGRQRCELHKGRKVMKNSSAF